MVSPWSRTENGRQGLWLQATGLLKNNLFSASKNKESEREREREVFWESKLTHLISSLRAEKEFFKFWDKELKLKVLRI